MGKVVICRKKYDESGYRVETKVGGRLVGVYYPTTHTIVGLDIMKGFNIRRSTKNLTKQVFEESYESKLALIRRSLDNQ